jgi:Zn-dependent protease
VIDIVIVIVAAVLAITLHEAAHGFAALAMGDDTARRAGRLSLNPLRHIDRVGTILLPLGLAIMQLATIGRIAFMFGWAKPVPVAAWKFPNPRRAMMVVAAAGPAMNFFLVWLVLVAFHVLPDMSAYFARPALAFSTYFILTNLVLGLFNLLPIPPLDGGRIAVGLLPEGPARALASLERGGIVIVLLLIFLLPQFVQDVFHVHIDPIGVLLEWAGRPLLRALVWLAGEPPLGVDFIDAFFGPGHG